MQPKDSLEALSLDTGIHEQLVVQKASHEDRVRRFLIALVCLWLLVGVVLPLLELVNQATHVELMVRVEEPTEQEKLKDDFRGQIDVAGRTVLLMMEKGRPVLYIDNQPTEIPMGRGEKEGIRAHVEKQRLTQVVCRLARPGATLRDRVTVKPIRVALTPDQRWRVDGEKLPLGENTVRLKRFIGLVNFFDYFGIQGLSQTRTLFTLGYILVACGLIGFFLFTLIRPTLPFNQNGMLTIAVLVILTVQAFGTVEFLIGHMQDSGLAQSVWNSIRVAVVSTLISVSLAFCYAYGIHRTLMWGKAFFRLVAMIPLFAPTMLYGLSLVYLFGNKGVVTTGFFDIFPWLAWDIGLYGFTGIVIAEIVFTFPPAFMILLVALANTDARLYEAAASLGAGKIRTFVTVTIPSVKFGLLSALFVCFTLSFTDFGAPKVVGGQFNILAVDIYKQVIGQQNFGMGATVSIILLIPTVLAFVADRIIQRRSVAVVTARSVPLTPQVQSPCGMGFFSPCAAGLPLLSSSWCLWPVWPPW